MDNSPTFSPFFLKNASNKNQGSIVGPNGGDDNQGMFFDSSPFFSFSIFEYEKIRIKIKLHLLSFHWGVQEIIVND